MIAREMRSLGIALFLALFATLQCNAWGQVDVSGLVAKGRQLKKQKKLDQAIQLLREAVIKDPKCAEAHSALGWIFMGQNDKFGATWHFRQVVVLAPNTPMGADALRALNKLDPGRPIVGYTPPPGSQPTAPPPPSLSSASQVPNIPPQAAMAMFRGVIRLVVALALAGAGTLAAYLKTRFSNR